MEEGKNLLSVLNNMLVDELNAFNQNMFHSHTVGNMTSGELFDKIEQETAEEVKQAGWLIKRIIILEVLRSRRLSINVSQNNSVRFEEKRSNVG